MWFEIVHGEPKKRQTLELYYIEIEVIALYYKVSSYQFLNSYF